MESLHSLVTLEVPPLNAHSDLLFGHNVLLGRYFSANSNKRSNKN
jgi:hypothetical protein